MTGIVQWAMWLALATGGAQAEPSRLADRLDLGGELSIMLDGLPRRDAAEVRPSALVDATLEMSPRVRAHATIRAAGLVARREGRTRRHLIVRPDDAWLELTTDRTDLRVGYGTVVWGRLDELQPTDVINPIDTAGFLLEGRAAARLPVGFARARYFASDRLVLEGVVVPWFRRSTFDELDDASSPFNLLHDEAPAGAAGRGVDHVEPEATWSHVSGGGRATFTAGRTDVSAVVFRGFDGFGAVTIEPDPLAVGPGSVRLVERHERFTMVGGDVESVVDDWIVRGEVAAFVSKRLAGVSRPGVVDGHVIDAGAGVERRSGQFRTSALVTVRRQWSGADPAVGGTDVSVLGSVERPFARERYRARLFGLVNPSDRSGFVRALFSWDARDNVTVDLSGAVFLGEGDDLVSRFSDRDFMFLRLGYYF